MFFPAKAGGGPDLMALLGGDTSEQDSRDANAMALLEAMQSVGEAGMRRTASPMGAIAQTLAPIFAAPMQARRMEQENALRSLLLKAKIVDALGSLKGDQPKNLEEAITREAMAGRDTSQLVGLKQSMLKPPADTEYNLQRRASAGDPEAQAILDAVQQRRVERSAAYAEAGAAARLPLELEGYKAKKDIEAQSKVKPDAKLLTEYADITDQLANIDSILLDIKSGAVDEKSAIGAAIPGGYFTKPTWQKYATFQNKLAHEQYGSAFTSAEQRALYGQSPRVTMFAVNRQGFIDSLKETRRALAQKLKTQKDFQGSLVLIPDDISSRIDEVTGIDPDQIMNLPTSVRDVQIQKIMKRTGWSRERAEKALPK